MSDEPSLEERLARLEAKADAAPAGAARLERAMRYLPWLALAHVAIGAPTLLLTLALAYATFIQADATRKMQEGGALPIIAYGTSNATEEGIREISLNLSNNGVGPALLGPLEMRYEGAIIRSPQELLQRCCGVGPDQPLTYSMSPASGIALRPGETAGIFRIVRSAENQAVWDRLNVERWKLEVRSCYCSIFDTCWIVEGIQRRPAPGETCPTDWDVYAPAPFAEVGRSDARRAIGS